MRSIILISLLVIGILSNRRIDPRRIPKVAKSPEIPQETLQTPTPSNEVPTEDTQQVKEDPIPSQTDGNMKTKESDTESRERVEMDTPDIDSQKNDQVKAGDDSKTKKPKVKSSKSHPKKSDDAHKESNTFQKSGNTKDSGAGSEEELHKDHSSSRKSLGDDDTSREPKSSNSQSGSSTWMTLPDLSFLRNIPIPEIPYVSQWSITVGFFVILLSLGLKRLLSKRNSGSEELSGLTKLLTELREGQNVMMSRIGVIEKNLGIISDEHQRFKSEIDKIKNESPEEQMMEIFEKAIEDVWTEIANMKSRTRDIDIMSNRGSSKFKESIQFQKTDNSTRQSHKPRDSEPEKTNAPVAKSKETSGFAIKRSSIESKYEESHLQVETKDFGLFNPEDKVSKPVNDKSDQKPRDGVAERERIVPNVVSHISMPSVSNVSLNANKDESESNMVSNNSIAGAIDTMKEEKDIGLVTPLKVLPPRQNPPLPSVPKARVRAPSRPVPLPKLANPAFDGSSNPSKLI